METSSNYSNGIADTVNPSSTTPLTSSSSTLNTNAVVCDWHQLPFVQLVLDLCYWKSPLSSSLTLLCASLLTFLLSSGYSVLTLLSYLLLLQLLTCFLFINISKFILKMKGHEANEGPKDGDSKVAKKDEPLHEYVSLQALQSLVPSLHTSLNVFLRFCMDVIRCSSNKLTIRVLIVLFVASLIGRVFDGVTIFGLTVMAFMSVPKLYQTNREAADQMLEKMAKALDTLQLVIRKKAAAPASASNNKEDSKKKK